MARQRHLANAPITEALIDIHVSPREGLTFVGLQQRFSEASFGYYIKNPITEGTFDFRLPADGKPPETSGASTQVGLRLHSSDEKYVAQCRLTGFTLSRLPPYENWEALVAEAQRIWSVYVERLDPLQVDRVATRYINNLRLPLEQGASYQAYLNKLVDVPDEVPQAVASFFQRFQLVDVASGARVNLTLALDSTPPGGPTPVILDLDAFMLTNFKPTDGALWSTLDRLRDLKNRSFFGTITEQAAELYA